MNPASQELADASKNLLGLVFGIRMRAQRKAEGLDPIVPEMFISVAATQAVERLDKAVREFDETERIAGDTVKPHRATKPLNYGGVMRCCSATLASVLSPRNRRGDIAMQV